MGSLSGCIAKAGALLSARDRATLNEAALKMRAAGGDRVEAEKTAVAQVIESLRKAEPKEATKAGVAFDPRRVFDQAAYHGSPYRFTKFTLDHLGKGEGTQVFGYGLYFASLKDVAEFYRGLATAKTGDKGQTYKVEIPEDTVLLDRNARLGEQPEIVREALKKLGIRLMDFDVLDSSGKVVTSHESREKARTYITRFNVGGRIVERPTEMTGERAYNLLSKKLGSDKAASEALLDAGVLGLKYLDAHSRAAVSEGRSHNYVIFRGEDVEIRDMLYQGGTQTDTPEFKRWFGDSKVVDAQGKPLAVSGVGDDLVTLYHGTSAEAAAAIRSSGIIEAGEYFGGIRGVALSPRRSVAQEFGEEVIAVRVPKSKLVVDPESRDDDDLDAALRDGSSVYATASVAAFPEQIKSATGNRGTFDPNDPSILRQDESGPLGGYDPTSRTMIFTPRANLSTALHESAHHFLELSRAFASAPDAPAQIKADFDILLRTYGVKGDTPEARLADWNGRDLEAQRAVHERFATEFERYLFEGKAPTQALQPLFSRFRTWMVALYQRLMGSPQGLPDLSPEVRGVMGRMLASEAAIKDAEASRAYATLPKEAFGGDAKAYQDYLDLGMRATERAVDELTQRSIKDMQWASGAKTKALKQLQAQHNAARKAIAEQVEAEWSESPAVRAEAALRDAHAQGRVEPGVDEAIALASGFRDADDMYAAVGAIRERGGVAAARDDFVRSETDRRMLIEHGDLVDPKAIDEAANAAVHNGARARFLATGLKVLTKSPVPVAELVRAAKETAAGMIGERKIGDLRVDTYLAAERRANKEVLAKVAKDPAAAIEAQRQAMLANRLAKTALDARAEVDKGLAYLKKMADGPDSIAIDARDQITAILERFELGGTRKRADTMRTLAQWIEGQKELGLEPDIPPEIMAEAFRTNYRELTVDQFRGLVDSIKQIEHLGRLENRLLTARRQETFAQARDAMVEGVIANAAGRVAEVRSSNTVTGRAIEGMRDFWASHITAAMFARRFDGGKDGGVVWEHLIRPANERGHWEVEQRAKATRDLVDIMKPVFALGRMGGNGEMFPSIGRKLNRQARLAFALNVGNDGNLQRLLDGNGYTREQIQPVLESLTAAEWKAVQGVWDYMETFRPQIAAKERRVMGREPEWVEPTPFTVKTADGQTLRLRGGYYPIKYDPRASARAETHQLAEDIAQQMRGAYTSATTRRSFTKARVDEVHNRPLLESLDGIYSGVQDVIHDLAWHEYLIDANRLMRDEALSQTIRSTWGPEAHQQLRTWLTDVAAGEAAARQAGERAVSWVRQGVSIAGLGFNVMNAMLQPLGFTQSISRIGPKWVGRGVAKALGSPKETAGQISEMSPFMRTRFMTRFRELNELRNVVQGQSKARSALDAGAYALMLRFQQLVDIPTWWGAYEKAIAEGSDQGRAAALADQAVIDSQGSGMVKDMASVMRGGQFQKLFTSFYTFFNTTFNLATERTASSQNKAALAAQYLLLFALPATMAAALKDALTPGESDDWNEEKLARKLLGENLGYLLNTMFLVRELGNPVSQSVKGEPFGTDYSGPAGLRMIGDASKVISKITKPDEVEWNDSLRKAVVNLAGDLARLPAAQINRTITGVQALREGKTSNPAAVLFGYQEPR